MYDWRGRYIEQDDEDYERPRCPKGHFLPKETQLIWVDAGDQGHGVISVDHLKELPPGTIIEPYWKCKCGKGRHYEN